MKDKPLLELKMSSKDSYVKKEYTKGYRIPLVSDVMFHTMFNNESRKKYVSYLLSLVLEKDFDEINNNIKFNKQVLDKDNYFDSKKTVDLVCTIDNVIYNVEMNNNSDITSLERNISYAADLYKSKMRIGSDYNYQNVIQININNFSFEGNDNVVERYCFREEETGQVLTGKLTIIYIYLPNIKKKGYNEIEKLTELEKWLAVCNDEVSNEVREIAKENQIMEDYLEESEEASVEEEVIGLYDRELHQSMLQASMIKHAREDENLETAKRLLKAKVPEEIILQSTKITEEGLDNLKKELDNSEDEEVIWLYDRELHQSMLQASMIKHAKEEGMEQGKKENALETAKKMLDKKINLSIISECTGLSIEELDKIDN